MDDQQNVSRTGLAETVLKWAAVGIPLLTAILDLISKAVNYHARPISEFRL